jgi:hypothetical protein
MKAQTSTDSSAMAHRLWPSTPAAALALLHRPRHAVKVSRQARRLDDDGLDEDEEDSKEGVVQRFSLPSSGT